MFRLFAGLEWKAFFRSKAFLTNLFLKIMMGLGALYFIVCFTILGVGAYFLLEESGLEPLKTVDRFLLYFLAGDLSLRFFLQKMPVVNIKPMLVLPVSKNKIVNYALGKTVVSFFNLYQGFFFLPFTVVLMIQGALSPLHAILWHVAMLALVLCNNFINILINSRDIYFYPIAAAIICMGAGQYYGWFDLTLYTGPFFDLFAHTIYMFAIPVGLAIVLYLSAFTYFRKRLYLDTGLSRKSDLATTENLNWLGRFGSLGTFLKNDIRLLRRNKRSKTTLIFSFVFILYGLLFFGNALEVYNNKFFHVFAAIFVSGGFLFMFGQFVPSWDSSYYQLMMSQNIRYKEYLESKWWLMAIATAISTVLASFYLYFGWKVYLMIVFGAIYNIGVNTSLVLLAGAYVKTPIDLTTSKQAFGDKQAFNLKTFLLSLPKLLLPILLFLIGDFVQGPETGFALLALAGVIGFALRNRFFRMIEGVYKREKYSTIAAYKEKP